MKLYAIIIVHKYFRTLRCTENIHKFKGFGILPVLQYISEFQFIGFFYLLFPHKGMESYGDKVLNIVDTQNLKDTLISQNVFCFKSKCT